MTEVSFVVKEAPGLPPAVFDVPLNAALAHQVVTAWHAGARQGTVMQKTRGDVRGGGRKPWKQKRTGRARAGSIRSPLWRGGGRIFPASPRDHSQKVNKRMYRGAMRTLFSELNRREQLLTVMSLDIPQPRTKLVRSALEAIGCADVKTLMLTSTINEALELGARNLPLIEACTWREVSPADLVWANKVVIEEAAVAEIAEWLA